MALLSLTKEGRKAIAAAIAAGQDAQVLAAVDAGLSLESRITVRQGDDVDPLLLLVSRAHCSGSRDGVHRV